MTSKAIEAGDAQEEAIVLANAKYRVDPSSRTEELFGDAACFLDSARALLNDVVNELDDRRLYGIQYLLDIADAALGKGLKRVVRQH